MIWSTLASRSYRVPTPNRHDNDTDDENADVYLVIRDAEKTIRWMNVTAYLKTRKDKKSRQIVFDGEKLDADAVLRARERHLPGSRR